MDAPALSNQSESFLSFEDSALIVRSSRVIVCRSFVPPGVVGTYRGDLGGADRWVLDLLFGRVICAGRFSATLEEDLDKMEGVVGADRPSM